MTSPTRRKLCRSKKCTREACAKRLHATRITFWPRKSYFCRGFSLGKHGIPCRAEQYCIFNNSKSSERSHEGRPVPATRCCRGHGDVLWHGEAGRWPIPSRATRRRSTRFRRCTRLILQNKQFLRWWPTKPPKDSIYCNYISTHGPQLNG